MNATLYGPEHFATLRPGRPRRPTTSRVLRRVLRRRARPAPTRPATTVDLPVVAADEIAGHVPADPLAAQGYEATLRVVELDRRTDPGNDTHLLVEITNTGADAIPHDDGVGAQVRVAARLLDPAHRRRDHRLGAGPAAGRHPARARPASSRCTCRVPGHAWRARRRGRSRQRARRGGSAARPGRA